MQRTGMRSGAKVNADCLSFGGRTIQICETQTTIVVTVTWSMICIEVELDVSQKPGLLTSHRIKRSESIVTDSSPSKIATMFSFISV